jgi:carboxylesterase
VARQPLGREVEAFRAGDGEVGALLLHGFTSTPDNLRGLGAHLAEGGLAVSAPLLPGHGTSWEDLAGYRSRDWLAAAEDAFHQIAAERDETFLVGLSGGAALSLYLASRYPEQVRGVVALASYVATKDIRRFFAVPIRLLVRSIPSVANDIADPDQREIAYERLGTASAHEFLRMLKVIRGGLPAVRSPLLIIHSRNDHVARPFNADLIYATVGSEDKEIVWLDRSYHVITLDYDKELVFQRTFEFIRERSSRPL